LGKRWPALDVDTAGQTEADLAQATADDFAPTAVEDTAAGLRFFFPNAADRDRAAAALLPRFSVSPLDVDDEDWARRSQQDLAPVTVGRLTILPAPPARPDVPALPALVIPPSMGFGTGHHATTRLCLAALQQIDLTGAEVLDLGTGSGVLAMAAVHLGAARALGVDDDQDAIQSAVESLALNPGLPAERILFVVGDLMTMEVAPADVVTANLTGGLLIRAADRLRQALKPGGALIMSGLQAHERDEVWQAFAGLELETEAAEDGWITFTARRLSNGLGARG
jgi:ribosomal protein L11 methyltransferase